MTLKVMWIAVTVLLLAAGGTFLFRSLNHGASQATPLNIVSPPPETVETGIRTSEAPPSTASSPTRVPPPTFNDQQPLTPTTVVNIIGVAGDSAPAPGYSLTAGSEVSNCVASRAAVAPDIVECAPTAAGADVCWVTADRRTLLCGTTPWEKTLMRVNSSEKVGSVTAETNPLPWGLDLANGARCQLRNGGSWPGRADDYVGYYHCDQPSLFVVGQQGDTPVDRSAPAWTALVGELSEDNAELPPPTELRIVAAYFAART